MKRWRKRLEREVTDISQKIHSVAQYLDYPDSKDSAILFLKGIQELVRAEMEQRKITPLYIQQKIAEEHYRIENMKGSSKL